MRVMRTKALFAVSILSLFAASSFAAEQKQMRPNGKYRAVSELCSDGTVYNGYENLVTSSTDDIEITMSFSDDGTVVSTSFFSNSPLASGSYTAKYTVDANGELEIFGIQSSEYPKESGITIETWEEHFASNPRTIISVNKKQLIMSYPGFDGFGRCTPPAFVINVYEKVFDI